MNQLVEFFTKLFEYDDWQPRWHSGQLSDFHGGLFIVGDLLIWSACFTIPFVITKYITKKTDAEFVKLYCLIAAFILACGGTHFLDAIAFWFPVYRLNALARLITGLLSWLTVLYCIRYLPVAFALQSSKALKNEIEQRKEVEQELRRSEEQVQTIIKNAPEAVVVIDEEGLIKRWNPAAEAMFGRMEASVKGKTLSSVIIPDKFRELYIQGMKNFTATGENLAVKTIILPALGKNEVAIEVELTASPMKLKDEKLLIAFLRDVTERRKSEAALRDSEERYRLLTSEVHDYGIIMLSPDGNIVSWNEGAERIKGYAEKEIIGKHFSIFHTQESLNNNHHLEQLEIAKREGRVEDEGRRVKKSFKVRNNVLSLK